MHVIIDEVRVNRAILEALVCKDVQQERSVGLQV